MVNKILIKKIGLTEASVLALLLDMNAQHGDDFFVTADTAKEILNIGRRPYDSAIASLKDCGIITTQLKGAPPKTYFVINFELLASFFEDVQNGQINLYGEDNSICTNRSTNNNTDNNTPNNPILFNNKDSVISHNVDRSKNIEERRAKFHESLRPYIQEYGEDMIIAFYNYWVEKNPKGTKMRFEMEKTFEINRRLSTWKRNDEERKFRRR